VSHVFRWDLDKTYLATDFDSIGALIRTAMQTAEEKQNIPGTAALMRELRRGPDGKQTRIHVISGSPRQMRRVLEQKLRLDGADIDSLTLKPNVRNMLRMRFRAVRDQLGYKLPALLESRTTMQASVLETCFGDDAELDGLVYRLYADICSHRVRGPALEAIITAGQLYPDQADRIRGAADRIPAHDPVERVLIHLETGSPTGRFESLGPRVVPTFNSFQASLVLFIDGRLDIAAVGRVVDDMISGYRYDGGRLTRSLNDALRRGIVKADAIEPLADALGLKIPTEIYTVDRPAETDVDYVGLLDEIHAYRAAQKAKRKRPSLTRLLGLDK
jgi:hypothetical protein